MPQEFIFDGSLKWMAATDSQEALNSFKVGEFEATLLKCVGGHLQANVCGSPLLLLFCLNPIL